MISPNTRHHSVNVSGPWTSKRRHHHRRYGRPQHCSGPSSSSSSRSKSLYHRDGSSTSYAIATSSQQVGGLAFYAGTMGKGNIGQGAMSTRRLRGCRRYTRLHYLVTRG